MFKKALIVLTLMVPFGIVAKTTKDNPLPSCFPCEASVAVHMTKSVKDNPLPSCYPCDASLAKR